MDYICNAAIKAYMRFISFALIFSCFLSTAIYSQYSTYGITNARNMGMANVYTATSYGLYSVHINPSLLAKERLNGNKQRFSLMLPNVSAQAYNKDVVLDAINYFTETRPIEIVRDIDPEKIMNALEMGGRIYLDGSFGYMSFGYSPSEKIGSFAFSMNDIIKTVIILPKVAVDVIEDPDKTGGTISLNELSMNTVWLRSYTVSYGREIDIRQEGVDGVYVGGALNYYNGFLYSLIDVKSSVSLELGDEFLFGLTYKADVISSSSEDFSMPLPKPTGRGFGLDIAGSIEFTKGVTVGLAFTDIGSIKWTGNTRKREMEGVIRIDSNTTLEDIRSYFDSVNVITTDENEFRSQAPTTMRCGFAFRIDKMVGKFPGRMTAALDIDQDISVNESRDLIPRFALGLEWKPGNYWPVFLTGISYDRYGQRRMALGLGYELKFLEIYFSTAEVAPWLGGGRDMFSASLTTVWYF